jgi:hypothetical protein
VGVGGVLRRNEHPLSRVPIFRLGRLGQLGLDPFIEDRLGSNLLVAHLLGTMPDIAMK